MRLDLKKTGYRTNYMEHKAGRKAVGLILALAYVINPYGLLLADDTADDLAPGDIAVTQADQELPSDTEVPDVPAEEPQSEPSDPADPTDAADDADLTEPADNTDNEDPTDPTDVTDAEDPADPTEPSDEEPDETDPSDVDPADPTEPTDITEPADTTDATEPSQDPVSEPTATPVPTVADSDDDQVIEDIVLDSTGKTWKVTATFGPECKIPSDAGLRVKELTSGSEYREYFEKTENYLDDRTVDYIRLFDISIVKDGMEIEPCEGTSVKVTIALSQSIDSDVCILHFPDDDDMTQCIDDVDVTRDDVTELTFDTTGFSVFAVAGYTMEKTFEAGDGNTYKFVLTYDDKAGFPDDSRLDVRELTGPEYDEYLKKTLDAVGGDAAEYARIFDVSVVTAAGEKIQPKSDVKVDVTLEDAKASSDLELVHFGSEPEKIDAVKDGKVLSFTTDGFSIYAIVDKSMSTPTGTGWVPVNEVSGVDALIGKDIYISQIEGTFFKNTSYRVRNQRYGITKTKPSSAASGISAIDIEDAIGKGAVKYQIEKVGDYYYFWCLDPNGDKKYVCRPGVGPDATDDQKTTLSLVADRDTPGTAFEIGTNNDTGNDPNKNGIYIASPGTEYCWNQQGNFAGNGFAAWEGKDAKNARFVFWYYVPVADDPYALDGESYGLMYYNSGVSGYGLMGDGSNNHVLPELDIRTDSGSRTVYVDEDNDITIWNFTNVSGDDYRLSSDVNGTTVYLKLDDSGNLTTTSSADEASLIKVAPGTGEHANKIYLSSNGYYLTYNDTNGFTTTTSVSNRVPLYLVEKTKADAGDSTVYSAKEVSVSDTVNVPNGAKVIVYTRVWNETTSSYDFYAIDHDGSLYPCYERGNEIMWVGDVLDSIQWDFTEYYWEGTTDPNYYYELYNPYSDKYIAPQLNGQILSDNKIGINLEGRRNGEYFTDITAWDNTYYNFAAVAVGDADTEGNRSIESVPFSKSDTFYFAILNPVETTDELHVVETENNADHGITMKIVDFARVLDASNNQQSEVSLDYFNGSIDDQKGLLTNKLNSNGYPEIVSPNDGASFEELFTNTSRPIVNADHLFLKSTYEESGYLEYNSCQNFATLLDENGDITNNFTVYKELGTTDIYKRNTLQHGLFLPLNNISAGKFATVNTQNIYTMDANWKDTTSHPERNQLDENDPRKYEKLYTTTQRNQSPNYYFGMEVDASFVQTPNGRDDWGHDLIFEFAGDDDFWFYVDGELVLDLGGIHSAQKGSVNFCTGKVVCNGNETTLRDIFIQNREDRGMSHEDAVADVADLFESKDGGQTYQFKDYSNHTTKIFYMERGAGSSNLHIRFNLASVAPGNVLLSKKVSGDEAKGMDFDLIRYPYQIFYQLQGSSDWQQLDNEHGVKLTYQNSVRPVEYAHEYKPAGSDVTFDKVYMIDPQHSVEIDLPDNVEKYRIVECGINTEVYDIASIDNAPPADTTEFGEHFANFDSGELLLSDHPSIFFENFVKDNSVRTLTVKKILYDENGENGNVITKADDDTRFSFRLSLSNGSGSTVDLTNRYNYYVADDQGKLCKWDPSIQDFVSTTIPANDTAISALTDSQREEITFYTSSYGSISQIPSGYSIMVPGLPAGTVFEVVERENEIPKGYLFLKYDGDRSSYLSIDGKDNSGIVRAAASPEMTVKNIRGWGLTINKDWTDKDYIDSYEPIYVALYENDTLIDGTVRRLTYPVTSSYYFFLRSFDNMIAREVKISNTNPTVDAEGTVTDPGDVTPLAPLSKVQVETVPDGTVEYTVDYKTGVPYGASANVKNIREDTITNVREGALIFDLYEWASDKGLKDGKFQITCEGTVVGEYTSDSSGRILIFYKFDRNKEYVLTQTESPTGFMGLSQPVTFSVDDSGELTLTDPNGEGWSNYIADTSGNGILGYVKIYNKPIALDVYKFDKDNSTIALAGAHFELYRQIYNSITGYVKSTTPMAGFEDLVSDSNGIIHITNADGSMLKPGVYYLTEKSAPSLYLKSTEDVVITVSNMGVVTIEGFDGVTLTKDDGDDLCRYTINYPNEDDGTNILKVTKVVAGNLGNKTQEFEVSVALTDGSDNPLANTDILFKINSDDPATVRTDAYGKISFTLKHDDTAYLIGLPDDAKFTVTEDHGKYTPEFFVDDVSQGDTSASGTIPANKNVRIVNTYEGVIPTGVSNACGAVAVAFTLAVAGFAVMIAVIRRRRQYYY